MKTPRFTKYVFPVCLAAALTCSAYPQNRLATGDVARIPARYSMPAASIGKIDTLRYNVPSEGELIEKTALVYLPDGYDPSDKSRRYNVLYLAHGGGDYPGSFFDKDRTPYPVNYVADHLIADGKIDPLIIVSSSYYPSTSHPGKKGMEKSIENCRDFNKELRGYLIPAVGSNYNTYLRSFDDGAITATREHRAYGGFSMGALSTWYQLAADPDAFSRYIPMSGDLWIYDEDGNKKSAVEASQWLNARIAETPYRNNDIKIYGYAGTKDIAYEPETKLMEALDENAPLFRYSRNPEEGNLHFNVLANGNHTYEYISQYLMDALPNLWPKERTSPYWLGADISGTTANEARGVKSYNAAGEERENTALMKELGLNAVRLRVWVNPEYGFCNKEDVLRLAKRAKDNGMAVMIDFHYADSWADPGKQPIPKEWEKLNYRQMKKAVANHTKETLELLKKNGIDVRWVQLGNETTNGMLWEMGRADTNMEQYAGLTDAAYDAVKKVYPEAICIVHLDCAADIDRYHRIFNALNKYGTRYDMIGMSVYPYWDMSAKITSNEEETLQRVVSNIKTLSEEYGKPVMIVEAGYEALRPNEGYAFMRKLMDATYPLEECHGVFYWAPELEGAYPLGAFENHRPTRIMDAFTETANRTQAGDTTFYSTRDMDCVTPNGLVRGTLYVPYVSPYAQNGRLPIVIMAHGFNGTFRETRKYAECLASNGIAAFIFDFYGGSAHTKSEGKMTEMSVYTEVADLQAVTAMIEKLPNIDADRIMLLGCSQGALVSTMTASQNPGRYKALMLMYPALGIPDTADRMLESTKDTPEEFEFWGIKLSQKYYRSIKGVDAIAMLKGFDGPVLLVYGENDGITPEDTVGKVKEAVKNATTLKIDKGNHGFPDPFNHRLSEAYVLRFVKDLLTRQ